MVRFLGSQGVVDNGNRAYSDSNPPDTLDQTIWPNASVPTPAAGISRMSTPDGKSLYLKAPDGTQTMIGPGPMVAPGPQDHGADAWTGDPSVMPLASTVITGGTLNLQKLFLPVSTSISTVFTTVATAGATLTNVGFALYSAAGNLLTSSVNGAGGTGSTATAFQSTGVKTVTFTSPQTINGYFYVGFWATGTTLPAMLRGSVSAAMNFNLAAPNLRFSTGATALTTAAPATMGTQTASANAYWVAVT